MDVFKTMDVVSAGLTAERTRVNAIASNLANAQSSRGVDGAGPYKKKTVILESVPLQTEFGQVLDEAQSVHTEVRVKEIAEDQSPPKKVYNPDHPDADAEGYVLMPNVNSVEESVQMLAAEKSYQANVNLFQTTKQMALKALEIGR